jgi:type IV pilus assembly protein PilV
MRRTPSTPATPTHQGGFLLIEVLVAVLIFSIGVLSLVGLQARAVSDSGQSRYRTEAALLANDLVSEMRLGNRSGAYLKDQFDTDKTAYNAWLLKVQALLPGSTSTNTTVAVTAASGEVQIVVGWRAPNETSDHRFTLISQIR